MANEKVGSTVNKNAAKWSIGYGMLLAGAAIYSAYTWISQGVSESNQFTVVSETVLFAILSLYFFAQAGTSWQGRKNPLDQGLKPFFSLLPLLLFVAFVAFVLVYLPKVLK